MRLNLFSRNRSPEPEPEPPSSPSAIATELTGKTFPADEVVWGIVIKNGFDELDDPWYHRGVTQHAYLEGNDTVSICGFRPPQSGPRTRRRARLGLPTTGEHPMCGMCARMVVAPRPRVPVPVQAVRPPVAVPVGPGMPVQLAAPVGVPARVPIGATAAGMPAGGPASTSPWVRRIEGEGNGRRGMNVDGSSAEVGLLGRGVSAPSPEEA